MYLSTVAKYLYLVAFTHFLPWQCINSPWRPSRPSLLMAIFITTSLSLPNINSYQGCLRSTIVLCLLPLQKVCTYDCVCFACLVGFLALWHRLILFTMRLDLSIGTDAQDWYRHYIGINTNSSNNTDIRICIDTWNWYRYLYQVQILHVWCLIPVLCISTNTWNWFLHWCIAI